jgi:DnaJ-class molecular chaperone
MKTCPDCNGDGVIDKDTDDERQCPTCGGLGFVRDNDDNHEEIIKTSRDLLLMANADLSRLAITMK